MLRSTPLLEGEVYHIYNRGANKADIFLNDSDYTRFKLGLFLFNTTEKVTIREVISKNRGPSSVFLEERPDQGLVDVLGYALMTNHFHLILRQKTENGITEFMKKVGTAYSMYFNTLYDHSGTVFQGRFKSKHAGEGGYLRWLCAYVALNPLDIAYPMWKKNGVSDREEAFNFLQSYAHASYQDLLAEEGRRRPEARILSFDALYEMSDDIPNFHDIEELIRTEAEPPEM